MRANLFTPLGQNSKQSGKHSRYFQLPLSAVCLGLACTRKLG